MSMRKSCQLTSGMSLLLGYDNGTAPGSLAGVDRVSNPYLPYGDGRITIVKSGILHNVVTGRANSRR